MITDCWATGAPNRSRFRYSCVRISLGREIEQYTSNKQTVISKNKIYSDSNNNNHNDKNNHKPPVGVPHPIPSS